MLKRKLADSFAMKDLGATKQIFGMRITRDRKNRKLTLSQGEYIEKRLHRFRMQNEKPVSSPLANHFKLNKEMCPETQEEINYMDVAHRLGCLLANNFEDPWYWVNRSIFPWYFPYKRKAL